MFAHVMMQKTPVAGSWLDKDKRNNIVSMFDLLADDLDEANITKACSIAWPTRHVGTCAQCNLEGVITHRCEQMTDAGNLCDAVFCWEHYDNHPHKQKHNADTTPLEYEPRQKRTRTVIASVLRACRKSEGEVHR